MSQHTKGKLSPYWRHLRPSPLTATERSNHLSPRQRTHPHAEWHIRRCIHTFIRQLINKVRTPPEVAEYDFQLNAGLFEFIMFFFDDFIFFLIEKKNARLAMQSSLRGACALKINW